jgi:hypothetical protein
VARLEHLDLLLEAVDEQLLGELLAGVKWLRFAEIGDLLQHLHARVFSDVLFLLLFLEHRYLIFEFFVLFLELFGSHFELLHNFL